MNFVTKIQFNHDKYIGDETLFCIGGFQNLNNIIQIKNGKSISICHLLKSIPATKGMSRPQLFQQAEPNPAAVVTIVTFQAQDREMVMARQATLEEEIRNVIADGKENKVFLNETDGIWFSGVNKNKNGNVLSNVRHCSKDDAAYFDHINRLMNSPPKKRIFNPPKWGGGIQPTAPIPSQCGQNTRVNSSQPSPPHMMINNEISNKFDSIHTELNIQRECNARFDARISNLEITTQSIDDKIDLVLERLASTSPSHKIQKNSSTSS